MLQLLAPNLRLDSVLDLTLDRVQRLGLRGLLLDIDCTLKDYHAKCIPDEVIAWLETLRAGNIRLCLLSNGKHRRIEALARSLDLLFVAKAFKPLPFGCYRGLRKLGLPARRIAVVGDQLFADVLAGKFAGLFTILVRPTSAEEPWFTRIKRPVERRFLHWLSARPVGRMPLAMSVSS